MSNPQSRAMSAVESIANIVIGCAINATMTYTLLPPLFDIHPTVVDAVGITLLYTLVSFARTYFIRRWFNREKNNG